MANEPRDEPRDDNDNEGEGSKTADRRYREGVEKFVEREDTEKLAREAERDVEHDAERYKRAEEEGKRRIAEDDPEDAKLI